MGEKKHDPLEGEREREAELLRGFYTTFVEEVVVATAKRAAKETAQELRDLLQFEAPRKPQTYKLTVVPDDLEPADDTTVLSTQQAAKQLGISARTLRRKVERNEIRAERDGKRGNLKFRKGELDRYRRRY